MKVAQPEEHPSRPAAPAPKETGLTDAEVLSRRDRHGENRLPEETYLSPLAILLSQLKSPLVYIILTAAGVSLLLGEYSDFAIIMVVVVIDVLLGFIQEYQAQRTYVALKSLLRPTTTVLREGKRREIEVWELVPGDLVLLNVGEKVPGDGELIEGAQITVDEAILTGESEPVRKEPDGSQNLLFMGTTVVAGRGVLRVTRTGPNTELGQIAASLKEHTEEDTPLQVRLKAFSRMLTIVVSIFTLVILVVGLLMGREFLDMVRISIILAIAAVPEGLLIAVTVILVLGMRKILRRHGLVKKLLAVETLGSVTVICTDKTGTLTEGRIRVTRANLADRARALDVILLCNDLEGPVDIALWDYTRSETGREPEELAAGSERLAEEMFTSETKFMITASAVRGERLNLLKGAPEIVLGMCSLPAAERARILAEVDSWAGEGLRLLGLAVRPMGALEDHAGYAWVGLLGMEDPVREGVVEAVRTTRRAGIRVKMITGDYRLTAERIAQNIGILGAGDKILEGDELARMTDAELQESVRRTAVFSRIRPHDKLRIVRALQACGEVTAMVGDGVNDAPALKRANIGVVVGSATDVAKETADLILLDSNFRTIVAAVEEGRIIFENIRKVIAYVLSNSFAEVLTIFVAMLLRWPAPLMVAQILWIHLICDGPSDIVLGFEPVEEGIMDEPPKSLKEPVLTALGGALIGVISVTSTIFALFLFGHFLLVHQNPAEGRSIVFASFAINSMVYIFAYRSMRRSLFRSGPLSRNKPLILAVISGIGMVVLPFLVPAIGNALGIVALTLEEWVYVVGASLALLAAVEIGKAISKWRKRPAEVAAALP
jgi:Ca2+-transporting ATPase